MSADTEALLATVRAELLERQAVIADAPVYVRRDQEQINAAHDALDSLAAELERVKAERESEMAVALSALWEIRDNGGVGAGALRQIARAAIAEIEGEA